MTAMPAPGTFSSDVLTEGLFQVRHQALLRTIIDGISEGVILADASGHILYFSPYAHKLLGSGPTDATFSFSLHDPTPTPPDADPGPVI